MNLKLLFSFALGVSLTAAAQGGYQDGVDNYKADRQDFAKVILNRTLNNPSTDKAVAHFYLGQIDFNEKNYAGAKANFEEGLKANPQSGINMIGLGMLDLKNGNKSEAQKRFDQALKLNKKDTEMMVAVARAYWAIDTLTKSQTYAGETDKLIKKALKESKDKESAVYILQGDMASDPGEAAGKYELAIMVDEEKGVTPREAYVKYARVYIRHNPQQALQYLEKLNQLEPQSGLAQRELAERYYDNEQMGRAWKQYEKYVKNPNHFQRDEQRYAGLLYSAKEYDQSKEWANKVLAQDPTAYQMYRVLMLNNEAQGQDSLTVVNGEKLFGYPGAELVAADYVRYGKALSAVGRAKDAIAYLQKAVAENPDRSDLLYELSQAYNMAEMDQEALETMKKYLDTGAASANDYFTMARRYNALARTHLGTPEAVQEAEEGIKYADMALERAPGNVSILGIKLFLEIAKSNNEITESVYQKAKEIIDTADAEGVNNSYVTAALYYAGSYEATHDNKEAARTYFERYLQANPDDQSVKKLLEAF